MSTHSKLTIHQCLSRATSWAVSTLLYPVLLYRGSTTSRGGLILQVHCTYLTMVINNTSVHIVSEIRVVCYMSGYSYCLSGFILWKKIMIYIEEVKQYIC